MSLYLIDYQTFRLRNSFRVKSGFGTKCPDGFGSSLAREVEPFLGRESLFDVMYSKLQSNSSYFHFSSNPTRSCARPVIREPYKFEVRLRMRSCDEAYSSRKPRAQGIRELCCFLNPNQALVEARVNFGDDLSRIGGSSVEETKAVQEKTFGH